MIMVTVVVSLLLVAIYNLLPTMAPSIAWKSQIACLQEPALEHLEKMLHVGMTYNEVFEIMGKVPPVPDGNDKVRYSYNVNFGFNRGIDVFVKEGRVVSVFPYD